MNLLRTKLVTQKTTTLVLSLAAAFLGAGWNSKYGPGVAVPGGPPPLKAVTNEDSSTVHRDIMQAASTPK
jgi:hypothetical protein